MKMQELNIKPIELLLHRPAIQIMLLQEQRLTEYFKMLQAILTGLYLGFESNFHFLFECPVLGIKDNILG